MKIFLAIMAGFLLFGMIGDKNAGNRKNYTYGFMTTVAAIVALYAIG